MIADISLENFRSYNNDSFEFSPSVNIIVGPNASGKTNLLESILMLARGSSYRAKDADLVSFDKPWAKIISDMQSGGKREVRIKKDNGLTIKQFIVDEKPYKRMVLEKTLPVVLFEPNHLQMLVGVPELRRGFLDSLLGQTVPGYQTLLRQYKRILAQRNRLLKNGPSAREQLFVWDIRLCELGAQIALARSRLVKELNRQAEYLYNELSGHKYQIKVEYAVSAPIENYASELLRKLEKNVLVDFERGFTAYGPHREDMLTSLNGGQLTDVASRGETRTLTLVFKILEARIVGDIRGAKPMLLLDDVFSELDGARRQALTRFLKDYQTFITTTDADVVIQHFSEKARIIPISKNK